MLGRLLLVVIVAWGATAVGAAGSPLEAEATPTMQANSVTVIDGPSGWTSVSKEGPTIDFERHGARGLSPNMRLVIGDPTAPESDHAFALRNDGGDTAVVSLVYRYDERPPARAGVSFSIVDAVGTDLQQGEPGEPPTVVLEPGDTAYVIVAISTAGTTKDDDLSGTLSVSTRRDGGR